MRVQAQSKHELDRKGSEQHVVGRPAKEKGVADHALLCRCKATRREKKGKAVSQEDLNPVQMECTEPAMACAACLEGGIRLERRSTAVTHTATDFMRLRHQSDYWL